MRFRVPNYVTRTVLMASVCGGLLFCFSQSSSAQSVDSAAAAAAEIRFQQLEREIRRLTGQLEEQSYEIRRLKQEIERLNSDLDVRLKDVEGRGPAPSVSAGAVSAPDRSLANNVTPPAVQNNSAGQTQTLGTITTGGQGAGQDPAARAYDHAYSFIKSRDFDRAETEFETFIGTYPNHSLISNAQYWYGETFYVRGQYEKAARIFAESYQKYPQASKASSNLLKLGMSLVGMGKTEDACVAYKQLKKEYAGTSIPVLKRADMEMKRIDCR